MKENVWLPEARQMAAQIWCDPNVSDRVMDVPLCEAVAKRIACWMATAAQNQRNTDYYRGLVLECAKHLGPEVRTCDDGSISDSPLCAKVPELVAKLCKPK